MSGFYEPSVINHPIDDTISPSVSQYPSAYQQSRLPDALFSGSHRAAIRRLCRRRGSCEVPLSLGVGGVNSSARTVDWSLIFRDEGDI